MGQKPCFFLGPARGFFRMFSFCLLILPGQLLGCLGKGTGCNPVGVLPLMQNGLLLPFGAALPLIGHGFTCRICKIKDIVQPVHRRVQQGDALRAPFYLPAHLAFPKGIPCTGRSLRALGVDEDLLSKGIFIEAGGGI